MAEPDLACDVLIFVVTSSERDALVDAARDAKFIVASVEGKAGKYRRLTGPGANRVLIARTDMGSLSHAGSTVNALRRKAETGATGLISLGMAFGIDQKTQKPSHILVSKELIPYDNRTVVDHGGGGIAYEYGKLKPLRAKESLIRLLALEAQKEAWRDQVSFGALLSGGARIRSSRYRDLLLRDCKFGDEQILGGEMEGIGIASACPPESPDWIVVKGICDFADHEQRDNAAQWRVDACSAAARFVIGALAASAPPLPVNAE